MRVAVTVEQSWADVPGGTARATNELIRVLTGRHDLGIDVVGVAARHHRSPPATWAPPVDVAQLPLPTLALFEGWHKLRRPVVERATGPVDLVHGTIIAVPASRAPLVLTIHDLSFLAYPEHFSRRGVRFFRRAVELARSDARLVTCPSQATVDECLAAGFEPERLRLIPWGVRVTQASRTDVEAARGRHGLGRPYVLFCGTIEPRKNLHRVIEAFGQIDRVDLDLVLAGPQGWNEDLDAALARLGGRVHTLGFVPGEELGPLYAGVSVVVYPSLREGFGLPVLEAMAQGAPVVTSRGTSTEEVAGDAALLVDPLDVDAIADAITQVVDRPDVAERLANAGRARAATFTWDRTADLMAAVYAEAVEMSRLQVGVNLLYLKPGRVGGTEDYVRRLLAALDAEAADEVELTLFVNGRFGTAYPELAAAHETVVAPTSGDHPPARIALEATWLARASARQPLDLVHHVANTVPHLVRRPAVVSIHDLQAIVRPQDFGRVKSAYLRSRLGPSARKARVVVTLSEYVRELVIDRFNLDPDRVMVVPGPIDLPIDMPPEGPCDSGAPMFVYPAITHPHKNHTTLIRAFRKVAHENPDVSLVLTGGAGAAEPEVKGEITRRRLETRIQRPGRIPRAELDVLLRRATALTFPSRHEGYGLPIAEAMALGCPVIASDTTALPEVVGEAGLLVDPDDVDGWAAAMTRLLDDEKLRAQLADAGRQRVAWLTPAETARRMVAAYRTAVASG